MAIVSQIIEICSLLASFTVRITSHIMVIIITTLGIMVMDILLMVRGTVDTTIITHTTECIILTMVTITITDTITIMVTTTDIIQNLVVKDMHQEVLWVGTKIIIEHKIKRIVRVMFQHQQPVRKRLLFVNQLEHKQQDILKMVQHQILNLVHTLQVTINQEPLRNNHIIGVHNPVLRKVLLYAHKKAHIIDKVMQLEVPQVIKDQHSRDQVLHIADHQQAPEVEAIEHRQVLRQEVTLLRQEHRQDRVQVTEVVEVVLLEEAIQVEVPVEVQVEVVVVGKNNY